MHTYIEFYCSDITFADMGYNLAHRCYYEWEYYHCGKWEPFEYSTAQKIESAYRERISPFRIRDGKTQTLVEFESMRHSFLGKQVVDPIRRKVSYDPDDLKLLLDDPRTLLTNEKYFTVTEMMTSLILRISKLDISSALTSKSIVFLLKLTHHLSSSDLVKLAKSFNLGYIISSYFNSSSLSVLTMSVLLLGLIKAKLNEHVKELFIDEGTFTALHVALSNFLPADKSDDSSYIEILPLEDIDIPFKLIARKLPNTVIRTIDSFLFKTRALFRYNWRRRHYNLAEFQPESFFLLQRPFLQSYSSVHILAAKYFLINTLTLIKENFFADLHKQNLFPQNLSQINMSISLPNGTSPCNNVERLTILSDIILNKNDSHITPGKVEQMNMVEFLLDFLFCEDKTMSNLVEFVKIFMVNFNSNPTKSPFYGLIEVVQEYLSYIEKFSCPCLNQTSGQSFSSSLDSLQNKIDFGLQHNCFISLKRHPECNDIADTDINPQGLKPLTKLTRLESIVYSALKKFGVENRADNSFEDKFIHRLRKLALTSFNQDQNTLKNNNDDVSSQHCNINDIQLSINGLPLLKELTLIQALISRYSSGNLNSDNKISGQCSLPSLYFGPSIVINYSRKIDVRNHNITRSIFNEFCSHTKKLFLIKKDFKNVEPYLGVEAAVLNTIQLLAYLHYINYSWGSIIGHPNWKPFIDRKKFSNPSISNKVNRLASDQFLSLLSAFPQWVILISKLCPFILNFSHRKKLFNSFNYSIERKLNDLLRHDRTLDLPSSITSRYQIKERNIVIDRSELYQQGISALDDSKLNKFSLSVTYKGEQGTGEGPTAEFYSIMSAILIKKYPEFWTDSNSKVFENLYPKPCRDISSLGIESTKQYFIALGQLIGRALVDHYRCDLHFSKLFYMKLFEPNSQVHLWCVEDLCLPLYNSFSYLLALAQNCDHQSIKELDLRFSWTGPDGKDFDLKRNGSNMSVTVHNALEYVNLALDAQFNYSIEQIFSCIRYGIDMYVPKFLKYPLFFPEELNFIISGDSYSPWNIEDLQQFIDVRSPYTKQCKIIQFLFTVLSEFTPQQQRLFLLFSTSTPRLPIGVVFSYSKEKSEKTAISEDYFLPSCSTCTHTIKLPNYSSIEILRSKLLLAITEGQEAFLFS